MGSHWYQPSLKLLLLWRGARCCQPEMEEKVRQERTQRACRFRKAKQEGMRERKSMKWLLCVDVESLPGITTGRLLKGPDSATKRKICLRMPPQMELAWRNSTGLPNGHLPVIHAPQNSIYQQWYGSNTIMKKTKTKENLIHILVHTKMHWKSNCCIFSRATVI